MHIRTVQTQESLYCLNMTYISRYIFWNRSVSAALCTFLIGPSPKRSGKSVRFRFDPRSGHSKDLTNVNMVVMDSIICIQG